jgi:hypothetical protein
VLGRGALSCVLQSITTYTTARYGTSDGLWVACRKQKNKEAQEKLHTASPIGTNKAQIRSAVAPWSFLLLSGYIRRRVLSDIVLRRRPENTSYYSYRLLEYCRNQTIFYYPRYTIRKTIEQRNTGNRSRLLRNVRAYKWRRTTTTTGASAS